MQCSSSSSSKKVWRVQGRGRVQIPGVWPLGQTGREGHRRLGRRTPLAPAANTHAQDTIRCWHWHRHRHHFCWRDGRMGRWLAMAAVSKSRQLEWMRLVVYVYVVSMPPCITIRPWQASDGVSRRAGIDPELLASGPLVAKAQLPGSADCGDGLFSLSPCPYPPRHQRQNETLARGDAHVIQYTVALPYILPMYISYIPTRRHILPPLHRHIAGPPARCTLSDPQRQAIQGQ